MGKIIIDGVRGALIVAMVIGGIGGALAADPTGTWLNETNDAHVKFYLCNDEELCGDIVWLKEALGDDGLERRDILNEDESLRGRLIAGLQIVTGLTDEGDGEWEDGEIYNVKDGETYDVDIELVDANTLNVSVCVFIFCKTVAWTRVQ